MKQWTWEVQGVYAILVQLDVPVALALATGSGEMWLAAVVLPKTAIVDDKRADSHMEVFLNLGDAWDYIIGEAWEIPIPAELGCNLQEC